MSYCVNCGVELAPSERECPLCGVEVLNPKQPWDESNKRPYPRQVENVSAIDSKYVASLAGLGLLIPVCVSFVANILVERCVTWSMFVVGGAALLFCYVLLPMFFKRPNAFAIVGADILVTLAFLWCIDWFSDGRNWFWDLGLPLVVAAGIFALVITLVRKVRLFRGLYGPAVVLFVSSLLAMGMDFIISQYVLGEVSLSWSWYVTASLFIGGVILIVMERRAKMKEKIRRKLFV